MADKKKRGMTSEEILDRFSEIFIDSGMRDTFLNMNLMDDALMSATFDGQIECAEYLVQTILGRKDIRVLEVKTQRKAPNPYGKEVQLDVYVEDSQHRRYNIEFQRRRKGADPRRSRMNLALLDASTDLRGRDYASAPDNYMVMITEGDYFGRGKATYTFERRTEDGIGLGDGSHIIYVNGSYVGDDEIGDLMHDLRCRNASEMKNLALRERVEYLKGEKEGLSIMLESYEAQLDAAEKRGEERGQKIGQQIGQQIGEKIGAEKATIRITMESALKFSKETGMSFEKCLDMIVSDPKVKAAVLSLLEKEQLQNQ